MNLTTLIMLLAVAIGSDAPQDTATDHTLETSLVRTADVAELTIQWQEQPRPAVLLVSIEGHHEGMPRELRFEDDPVLVEFYADNAHVDGLRLACATTRESGSITLRVHLDRIGRYGDGPDFRFTVYLADQIHTTLVERADQGRRLRSTTAKMTPQDLEPDLTFICTHEFLPAVKGLPGVRTKVLGRDASRLDCMVNGIRAKTSHEVPDPLRKVRSRKRQERAGGTSEVPSAPDDYSRASPFATPLGGWNCCRNDSTADQ